MTPDRCPFCGERRMLEEDGAWPSVWCARGVGGWMMALRPRDEQHLAQVRPALAAAVRKVLAAMAALEAPMVITDGRRTPADQQALYARGRTAPGRIVTYVDGVTVPGAHVQGRAVDCAFWVAGTVSWDARQPWAAYGACAEAVGLRWGGRWRTLVDLPHIEWPED